MRLPAGTSGTPTQRDFILFPTLDALKYASESSSPLRCLKVSRTSQVASQIKGSELVPLHHELDRDSVDAYYDRLDGWYRLCRNSNYDRYFLKDKDGG